MNIETVDPLLTALLASPIRRKAPTETKTATETENEREIVSLDYILRALDTSFPDSIFAGARVRTKPARTYDNIEATSSSEGSHIPYLLARLKAFKSSDWQQLREKLIEFGVAAGLFHDIDVKKFGASAGSPFQTRGSLADHVSRGPLASSPPLISRCLRLGVADCVHQP
jgi:hypothetical protein